MKVEIPMINWHGQLPILSVDMHSSGRLATAGQDGTIRVRSYLPIPPWITFLSNYITLDSLISTRLRWFINEDFGPSEIGLKSLAIDDLFLSICF